RWERDVGSRRRRGMRRATLFLTVIALAACSGAGGGRSGSRVTPSPATEALDDSPIDLASLSGRIAFDNIQDVWSINADGTDLEQPTHSPWREFDPSWSPDGRFIAYRAEPHDHPELWVMNADGSGQHPLTSDGGFPDWSSDGSLIAYAPGGGPSGRSGIAI